MVDGYGSHPKPVPSLRVSRVSMGLESRDWMKPASTELRPVSSRLTHTDATRAHKSWEGNGHSPDGVMWPVVRLSPQAQ